MMKRPAAGMLLLVVALLVSGFVAAQAAPATAPSGEIQAVERVLKVQSEAWNRGDIVAFMQGYEQSEQTTFVGSAVEHGYAAILDRYKKKYGSRERMGTLRFDQLETRLLDARVAVTTGRFHLTREAAAGGDATGVFSLVFDKTSAGWKIVLDHTSSQVTPVQ